MLPGRRTAGNQPDRSQSPLQPAPFTLAPEVPVRGMQPGPVTCDCNDHPENISVADCFALPLDEEDAPLL